MCATETIPESITIKFVMNVVFFRSVLSIRCLFLWSCRCLSPTNLHHYMHMSAWRWTRETMSVCFNVFPGQEATASNAFRLLHFSVCDVGIKDSVTERDAWLTITQPCPLTPLLINLHSLTQLWDTCTCSSLLYTACIKQHTLLACTGRLVWVFAVCRFLFEVD